jgi:beta-galactosidase
MYTQCIRIGSLSRRPRLKHTSFPIDGLCVETRSVSNFVRGLCVVWPVLLVGLFWLATTGANAQPTPPASDRIAINLSQGVPNFVGNVATADPAAAQPQSNWWYENNQDSTPTSSSFAAPGYVEVATPTADSGPACGSTLSAPNWTQVGIPTDANIWRTFINQAAGGGQGSVCGQNNWYRLHFKVDPAYANSKIMVEFEGAHTGMQIYINGTLLPGISTIAADAQASHVVGFIPVIADLTPYITADGNTENVLAVSVSRGNSWFEDPQFSEVFRFGQAMAGLFRPVKMFITNKVHVPVNVYSNQATWGTYVATVSEVPSSSSPAQAASAVVQVETNVLNETTTSQQVTLSTQIVDANGNVVATGSPLTQTVAPMTAGNFPSTATPMFSEQITVNNPTLWYPNNSIYGTPYMYTVNHIVSMNGVVVDVAQSPLGIRTITWNTNYPIFNGYPMNLWGGSGRYDYPALGSSVPEEQQWRDLSLLAAEGGNIYRPGHSTSSEEFVNAADAYGIMIDQPSGDNEEAFAAAGDPSADMITMKEELQRDMIVRDRNHPSILDWESNNGTMEESIGTALLSINSMWDPINTRVAADRTPDNVNGYLLGCTLEGCEVGVKETTDSALGQNLTDNPAWGAEYWGTGTARGLAWNYELAFVAPFLDNWRLGKAANTMGMAQWYLADTPGETGQYIEAGNSTTAPGNSNEVRSLGASSLDQNRFPKLLYYVYEAAWTPFTIKPVVRLAGHWNLSAGNVQVNAFSNCTSVELLINGVQQGSIETPNPWTSNDEANQTQSATMIPFQTSWIVPWVSGTVTAECLNASGTVVATDTRTTAGAENKIVLTVVPELTKPNGTTFEVTANGSDAAFVTATVEDANGNWEPVANDTLTFSVTGPATYQGGTQQYVSTNTDAFSNANSTYVNGVPDAFYMSPGDPQLAVEGGLTRIAVRSQFTPGTVTVTATAPGLASGSVSFPIVAVPDPRTSTSSCTAVTPAPTGLTATASSSSVISLNWTAVTPPTNCSVSFYNIYSSTTSGFTPSSSNLVASGIATAGYSDTGLPDLTTYYFIVQAVDAAGTSAASAQVSATTPVTPPCSTVPSAPTGLTATPASPSVIDLTWTADTAPANCTISSYSVYRSTTSGFTPGAGNLVAGGLTTASYSNTGLASYTTSYYVVEALDSNGASAASTQATATTPPTDLVSINAGGAAVSNSGGGDNPFVADEDYTTGGTTYSVPNAIAIPSNIAAIAAPAAVYQDARQGAVTYTIPGLTAGTNYTVRLHFAELYFSAAASREFNVAINGASVLSNFDIYATAGSNFTAVVEQYIAAANSGGDIVVAFTTGALDQPSINGIEVLGDSSICSAVPSAPNGLTATATSSSILGLTWTATTPPPNCSINSYNVYRSTTSGFTPSSSNLIASGVTSPSYSNTGLAASTTYYYAVEAVDLDGASAPSTQASAETSAGSSCDAVPPTGPTGLTATASSSTAIGLSWTAAPENPPCTTSSYTVYRSTTNGFTPSASTLDASGVTGTTYTDTGLATSTTYYYLVEALDSFGASAASNQAGAGGSCTAVPAAPTGLIATASSSTAVGLTWAAVTPPANCSITSYSVYGSTTNGFTPSASNLISNAVTSTSYSNTGLSASTTYYYKVEATDAEGNSTASTQASTETQAAASGNEVVAIAAGGPAQSNTGGGDYSFVADEDFAGGGDNGTITATISLTQPGANAAPMGVYQNGRAGDSTYTIPGLTAGSTYTVLLHFAETYFTAAGSREFNVAINGTTVLTNLDVYGTVGKDAALVEIFTATANSSGQIVIAFTAGAANQPLVMGIEIRSASGGSCNTIPSAPTGLTATASSSSAIGLSWSAVTPPANCSVSSYNVYSSTTSGFTPSSGNLIAGTTSPSYSSTGLVASTTYYYVVEAVDSDGSSAASAQVSAKTSAAACLTVPSAPTGLTATATSSTAISLTWTAVTPPTNCSISSYSVYGSKTSGFTPSASTLLASGVTGTTYSNTALTASTTYYYVVEAVDADGTSAASAQETATTQAASGGAEIVAIAAGDPAESNSAGGDYPFVADEDFSGGGDNAVTSTTINLTQPGTNAAPAAVYQHARAGVFTYTIPGLTAGTQYTVLLHFAETYFTAAGDRVFNVAINGTMVLTNFDIYATVGVNAALVESFTATANSTGQIIIGFTVGTANQPVVSGIEIR